jgi:hypothetical protein
VSPFPLALTLSPFLADKEIKGRELSNSIYIEAKKRSLSETAKIPDQSRQICARTMQWRVIKIAVLFQIVNQLNIGGDMPGMGIPIPL